MQTMSSAVEQPLPPMGQPNAAMTVVAVAALAAVVAVAASATAADASCCCCRGKTAVNHSAEL